MKPSSILLAFILLLAITSCNKAQVTETGKATLIKDTTWQGKILVTGDIHVPPGVTLTIAPGTIISFQRIDAKSTQNLFVPDSPYYPEAEIIVQGRLLAKGTKDEPIVFTSAEVTRRPADWGAINFLGSDDNVIEYTRILCAYNGIHAHGSSIRISHSEFINNGVGISFKKEEENPDEPWYGKPSRLTINHNLITRNKGGIAFRNSSAIITNNEIIDNKFFGIFPKEEVEAEISFNEITDNKKGIYLFQAKNLKLINNNIYDNKDYDIAVAEAQDFDVDARNNWFGTTNKDEIQQNIFDGSTDPDLGKVLFIPFLTKPVSLESL